MKYFLVYGVLLFGFVPSALAHTPVMVEKTSPRDITQIEDPELSQAFYGVLTGNPHTFEIRRSEPFELYVQILAPRIEGISDKLSVIVTKETGFKGRVSDVVRLLGLDAAWETFYEPWGGDYYLKGLDFKQSAAGGVYRIEVSTPENYSPYVLVVGEREDFALSDYFTTVGRIADVKEFYGKSRLMVIQSPLVYVPLLVLLCLGVYVLYRRLKINHGAVSGTTT